MASDVTSRFAATKEDEGALGPYARAIGAHRVVVALTTIAALVACAGWLAMRAPSYEATAEILVTPLPQDDPTFQGLPFLRDYGEATRTIQTAATLVASPAAADVAARRLGAGWSRQRVEDTVVVEPQGESNVLAVTSKTDAPELSARSANVFADAALDVRTNALRRAVTAQLERLQAQQERLTREGRQEAAADLASRISALEGVVDGNDPTLTFSERAAIPTASLGAPKWLLLALALIAGFTVGTGLALLLELAERRVRDEDELLAIFPAPVLARTPIMPRRSREDVATPAAVPPSVREAYRTLRVQLERQPGGHRTVLMTSASAGDGKTTSALNLALSLVAGGHRVLLIDFDLRKPELARVLGIEGKRGLVATLTGTPLSEIVVPAPQLPPLQVVTAANTAGDVALLESLRRRLPAILEEARTLADYVVIDTPPLGEVSDAITIADHVDDIVVVARPGHTNRVNLETARELLAASGVVPTGLLVVGQRSGAAQTHYTTGLEPRQDRRRLARSSR